MYTSNFSTFAQISNLKILNLPSKNNGKKK